MKNHLTATNPYIRAENSSTGCTIIDSIIIIIINIFVHGISPPVIIGINQQYRFIKQNADDTLSTVLSDYLLYLYDKLHSETLNK